MSCPYLKVNATVFAKYECLKSKKLLDSGHVVNVCDKYYQKCPAFK